MSSTTVSGPTSAVRDRGFALLVFAGAAYRRGAGGDGAMWAATGLLEVAGVAALFSVLVASAGIAMLRAPGRAG